MKQSLFARSSNARSRSGCTSVLLRALEAGMAYLTLYLHRGSSMRVQRRGVVVFQAVGAELGGSSAASMTLFMHLQIYHAYRQ